MTNALAFPLTSALKVVQSFKETTWGTPGVATSKWMGVDPNPSIKPYYKLMHTSKKGVSGLWIST